MTAPALANPYRRGACPGLSAPMPTGDGLLVRLQPLGTIPLDAFAALCAAARSYGNGIVEITARGSMQVRGLSETSAPKFAHSIAALGVAAEDGVPILCNPLAGLDAGERFDSTALALELRHAIVQRALAARLSPKISIVIDGSGAISLDAIAADLRFRTARRSGDIVLDIGVGGDTSRACKLGPIACAHSVETAMRLLNVIAQHGREARGRDVLAAEGVQAFRTSIGEFLLSARCGADGDPGLDSRGDERSTPIGTFPLHDGTVAAGIGLAFGHADANALERLVDAARSIGAMGLRTAPERALLAIGLAPDRAPAFAAKAERLGFVTRADDPRRRVVACAGAPICASAHIASRALAPAVAADIAEQFADTIHISGCAKGCAHAAQAALTVVGTADGCALIADGAVRDAPFALVPEGELRAAMRNHVRVSKRETAHV